MPVARLLDYERQQHPWTCGAAALCMVYRSLEVSCSQEEIWARLNEGDGESRRPVRTHRLAADALRRGLSALVLEASEPWPALETCVRHVVPVIVNHRLLGSMTKTHFSVLAGLGPDDVILDDPLSGPCQRFRRSEFQDFARYSPTPAQAAGYFLIAFAAAGGTAHACARCGTPTPFKQTCPGCEGVIPLQPAVVLGCIQEDCPARTWQRVWCPYCDAVIIDIDGPRKEKNMVPPEQMQKLAQAIEQYHGLLRTAQAAAPDSKAREQLEAFRNLLQNTHAQLQEGVKRFNSDLEAKAQKIKEMQEEAKKKVAEAAEKRQQTLEKVTARAVPAKEIDPLLGEKLKSDLLEEFGNRDQPRPAASTSAYSESKEVWQDWPAT